ncbi:GntP family permease [Blastopirellula marina]|uniref:Probable Gnt-II system L-idonate transporter n=1 Tax=Blastopirellula marina DSM 3645 TaxID=314230 RepID=A3ZMZ5_9BACT|nr:SLC13 family permease [Blastopirellula marina]EAQ82324.1 probable Gnt-II system L-idonate transporter [Blastopirellula marina DSM 3645]
MTPDEVNYALLCLGVGMATVLGLIIVLRANAFIAMLVAAMVVSLMADGSVQDKFSRVASAFGGMAGGVGIVIALAAIIGKCMLDSGAADRVVRWMMSICGEERAPAALMGSGFILAVPVFFDTVFYLLVPLARSLFRRTKKNYLLYVMAIATGGAITHTLVPPTPGPLVVADQLGVDKGTMILIGACVALPGAIAGLLFSMLMNRWMPLPMRPISAEPEPEELPDRQLPSLFVSLLPVLLPVLLISTNTVLTTIADGQRAAQLKAEEIDWPAFRAQVRTESQADADSLGKRMVATINESEFQQERRAEIADLLLRDAPLSTDDQQALVEGLNQFVLTHKPLAVDLPGALPPAVVKKVNGDNTRMKPVDAERMNRQVLESIYGDDLVQPHVWNTDARVAANWSAAFGDANFALLLSAIVAMATLAASRNLSLKELAQSVEVALMSGGVIILITCAGGAFGAMLGVANVGPAIREMFSVGDGGGSAIMILLLGFSIASLLKIAQGSSTVAMITGAAMLGGLATPETLGCNPVYLATAIGSGSLMGSWMNDSGFWVFAKMSGLTEVEALKSWTLLLLVLGGVSFLATLILATLMPLV